MASGELIRKASETYKAHHKQVCWFERAVFLSWYCSRGDCKFCYMSTQKNRITNPRLAKRRPESIISEVLIAKAQGWRIEFLSGGFDSYSKEELCGLIGRIHAAYGRKLWLNLGAMDREALKALLPYTEGICGAVETVNEKLHREMCPSKPISEVEEMLGLASEYSLGKAITIIIGLGESIADYPLLKEFITRNSIGRITFYALNPHEGTIFTRGPEPEYYAGWIARTRIDFPEMEIIAGSWTDRLGEIGLLLDAGANAITKFPAVRLFGTGYASLIEQKARESGREFLGSMTQCREAEIRKGLERAPLDKDLKEKTYPVLERYIRKMMRHD